jgi:hypothetical protein
MIEKKYLIIENNIVVNVIIAEPKDLDHIRNNHQAIVAQTDANDHNAWIGWSWDGSNFNPPKS